MQKNKIWILLSVILLIVIAILGYNLYEQKNKYATITENDYNKAFYEVVDYVQNVKTYLAKTMVSKTAEHGAEMQRKCIGNQRSVIRMQQCTRNRHRHIAVAAQFFRSGHRQHHGQEVKGRVSDDVEKIISIALRIHPQQYRQSQHRFYQTCTDDGWQHRCKDRGNEVKNALGDFDLLRRRRLRPAITDRGDFLYRGKDLGNFVANDNLELPTAAGHAQHALDALDDILLRRAVITEREPQPGLAVGQTGDIALAANALHNRTCYLLVIHCFSPFSTCFYFIEPAYNPAPTAGRSLRS